MERPSGDGFIMPDGEFIALNDVERMFAAAKGAMGTHQELAGLMMGLGRECAAKDLGVAALAYFRTALGLLDPGEMKAYCLLSIGQLMEGHEDLAGALDSYLAALQMEPVEGGVRYLLHNNTGYCLNRLGRHAEAEEYCRRAIDIDPRRQNAYKNLGVTLQGMGRYPDAVASYVTAAENCPADNRALELLEALYRLHPATEEQTPDLRDRVEVCRRRAASSRN
jgi:tetratricopeptide (TPR) repeat protein